MLRPNVRHNRRAGVLLDLVVGSAVVLLGAFALASLGITLPELLRGAGRFFGFA